MRVAQAKLTWITLRLRRESALNNMTTLIIYYSVTNDQGYLVNDIFLILSADERMNRKTI